MTRMNDNPRRDEALRFLLGRIDYERAVAIPYATREFRLGRMREFLARLGNPQDRLNIVHVAGTKGKGSTSAMIAAALSAAGYRTGLYTSPHLDRLEERVMVDGRPCSADEFVGLVNLVRPIVEQMDAQFAAHNPPECGPTYFEITTAMALLHFAAAPDSPPLPLGEGAGPTDIAVLEVGLGGRLDSTNVCQPLVSVITSISFDHMKQLGNTLAEIAAEKAGIIKAGVPVISGVIDQEPRRVIAEIAQQRGSRLVQLGDDFRFEYHPPRRLDADSAVRGSIDFEFNSMDRQKHFGGVEIGLIGRHQAANAAVALATLAELRAIGWQLPEAAMRRGLAEVRWPARVEIISHRPTIVIDAAHNVASVQSLLETLDESFANPRRLLIFATTLEKDVRGMLELLLPRFEAVILTRYLNNPRAVGVEELDALAAELSPSQRFTCPDPAAAWRLASEIATPEHLICVTGSFFLASEIRTEVSAHPTISTSQSLAGRQCPPENNQQSSSPAPVLRRALPSG
jgi:dihydrofolate synthase / folylpolyglutamate synthase